MMTNPSLLLLSLFIGLMVVEVRARATHHVSADLSSLAQRHREHRHRQKQLRKNHIRDHIETSLNWKGKKMPTAEEVQARVAELPEMIVPQSTTIAPSPLSGGFVERVQSFHPMCFDDVDEKLLRQLPVEMSHKMSLFFNMRLPTVEPGSRLKLIEAKLRLQKQELAQTPSSNYIVTVFILNVTEGGFTPAPTVILDTLMVREFSPGWISLDITAAVDEWRKRPKQDGSLEGALVVEVEDTSQNPVPAADFLSAFPCQPQESMSAPLPSSNLIVPPTPALPLLPLIDIATLELPADQQEPTELTLFGLKKSALDPGLVGFQDLEIRHGASEQVVKDPSRPQPGGGPAEGNTLNTFEEVDYLPLGPSLPSAPPVRRVSNLAGGRHQPIKTRLVVSRDELEQLLEIEEEHEHQRQQQQQVRIEERLDRLASRQEEDEELFRRILSSLMSSEENERVWGPSSN